MHVDRNKEYTFNDDQFLFKYMDLHRLIYFLTTEKLFFSPLLYFDDPLEGISETLLYRKHLSENNINDDKDHDATQTLSFYHQYLAKVQSTLFASCWFLGIRESQAMWETYSNSDSVALRFKPQHLCEIMINNFTAVNDPDFEAMIHGKVEYFKLSPFDPTDPSLKECKHRYSGFLKDISYKHEEEFRFLLMRTNETQDYPFYEFSPGALQELRFDVISHPNMEDWKYNNIYNILKSQGLESRLSKSEIPTRRRLFETP